MGLFDDFLKSFNTDNIKKLIENNSFSFSADGKIKSSNPKYNKNYNNSAFNNSSKLYDDYEKRNNAITNIQKSLNVLNVTDKDNKPLKVDGDFGTKTQSAWDKFAKTFLPDEANKLENAALNLQAKKGNNTNVSPELAEYYDNLKSSYNQDNTLQAQNNKYKDYKINLQPAQPQAANVNSNIPQQTDEEKLQQEQKTNELKAVDNKNLNATMPANPILRFLSINNKDIQKTALEFLDDMNSTKRPEDYIAENDGIGATANTIGSILNAPASISRNNRIKEALRNKATIDLWNQASKEGRIPKFGEIEKQVQAIVDKEPYINNISEEDTLKRVSEIQGKDVLGLTILNKAKEIHPWLGIATDMAGEMVTDPTTFISGPKSAVSAVSKMSKATNVLGNVADGTRIANKTAEIVGDTAKTANAVANAGDVANDTNGFIKTILNNTEAAGDAAAANKGANAAENAATANKNIEIVNNNGIIRQDGNTEIKLTTADDGVKVGGAGKFIDNTTDTMTRSEKLVVDDLVSKGKTVERIPRDPKANNKSPDFEIDGVKTELKTLENANTNTGMKRIQEGFKQGAETVIIDARGSGITNSQASEIISRVSGKYPGGKLPGNVEIWIDGQVISYP